jgi:uncharacterized membrane protein
MKHTDIEKLLEAGLITADQHKRIVEHFELKEDGGKFLAVISFVGAILAACGIVLLIASNWDEIPRGVKIAAGLLLMLGAHGGGWYLREVKDYRKSGAGLHLLGSALFLGNIALIGQIYHLSARPPNAFLLWWAGIAALPWLLRSKAQHILSLFAFGLWFGFEINQEGSAIYFGGDERQIMLFALLGLFYLGAGYVLRRTAFAEFASATEKLGLLVFFVFLFPLTWGAMYGHVEGSTGFSAWIFPALGGAGMVLLAAGIGGLKSLNPSWRLIWGLALLGMMGVVAGALYFPEHRSYGGDHGQAGYHWLCIIALFVFCLLQIQVGIHERSEYMVNLAVAFIGLDIISTYITLFGTMAQTGLMFLAGGVFLILLGIFLEKKRRALMRKMKVPIA